MPKDLAIFKIIAALNDLGYAEQERVNDLVVLDIEGPGAGYPIVLDISRETIPEGDIIEQLENSGVNLNAFYAALEAKG